MSKHMGHDEKETAIEFVRAKGTLKAGAEAAGVTYQTLRNEIKRSPLFARRITEAQTDGKSEIGDKAIENIKSMALAENNKDVRSRLTANMALANWTVPGFRGESKVTGRIEHNIRVTSAIPRPNYKGITVEHKKEKDNSITEADREKLRLVNSGAVKLLACQVNTNQSTQNLLQP